VEANYGNASTMGMKHAISGHGGYLDNSIGQAAEGHFTDQIHSRLHALEEFAIKELEFQPAAGTEDEDMPVADALGSLATYSTEGSKEAGKEKFGWKQVSGYIPKGGDCCSPQVMTVFAATNKCALLPNCVGFCHAGPPTQAAVKIHFKNKANVTTGDNQWTSYVQAIGDDVTIAGSVPKATSSSGTSRGGCCGFMKKRRADQDEERAANLGISKKDSEAARTRVTETVPESLRDARLSHGGTQSFAIGQSGTTRISQTSAVPKALTGARFAHGGSQSFSVGQVGSQTSAETAPGAGVGDLEESASPPLAREDEIRGKDASDDHSKIPEELPSSGVFSGLEL